MARQKRFSFRTLQIGQLNQSTSVTSAGYAKLSYYGISVRWGSLEPAWTLPFRAPLWKKPHKIWRKCVARDRRSVYDYAQVEQSLLTFKEDYEWQLA
jgi:hypothetical protein